MKPLHLLALVLATACGAAADGGAPGRQRAATEPVDAVVDEGGPSADPTGGPGLRNPTALGRYDFGMRSRRFDLPGRLDEISGLAFTPDGRLFAHDDERGRVYELDPRTGEVGKRFDLGDDTARDDFEGIAIVDDRFFLISSTGLLYEFREGSDGEDVQYRMTDTKVGAHCEVEGLDHDPVEDVLLIACKTSTPDRSTIVVHRLPMDPSAPRRAPLAISGALLEPYGLPDDFAPSAVLADPSGSILLLSGRDEALVEVDRDGRILGVVQLSKDRHPQPEGLEIGPDGALYISDEKNGKEPRLTVYDEIDGGGP